MSPGTLPVEFLLVGPVKLESDGLWRRNNCTTQLSESDIDGIISSGMFYELKWGSPQHAVRNRLLNIADVVGRGHQSEPVCHPMNFSNPYVNPRKITANTNHRKMSKVPVKARTLKIYDNDAPTNAAM